MPFDQHYLLACVAPRKLHVSSAAEDIWADPDSEFLSCVAAGTAFESDGFLCEDRLPQVGDAFHGGSIGYDLRMGKHHFSRRDWLRLMEFLDK